MTSKKFIILLFSLALISGIFWCVSYGEDPGWSSDALGYDQNALTILEKGVFFKGAQILERPLYPVFLAGIYKIFEQIEIINNFSIYKILDDAYAIE